MKRKQIEKIYKINKLDDYKLRNNEDLLKCHGIDYKETPGYNRLDDLNRHIYKKFIINFYNASGLESRSNLMPKGIYFVEDIEKLCKTKKDNEYYNQKNRTIYSLDRNGFKNLLYSWNHEDYKDFEVLITESSNYLRFEYEHHEVSNWLHIVDEGTNWY